MSQAVRFPGGYPAEERLYVLRALAMQAHILYTHLCIRVRKREPAFYEYLSI